MSLRFAGYAALFDTVDRGGDVIRRGAFSRAVEAGAKGLPLLWQHQQRRPIGRIESIAEDARGLRVIGRLTRSVSVAGAGVFTGSAAEARLKGNALAGTLDDYQLCFADGGTISGRFLLTKLDYSGDFNGERSYTLALESSGQVASA